MPGRTISPASRSTAMTAGECVLVRQAAEALKQVQADLRAKNLTLKVYDCYRPARAVAAFVDWAKEPDDPKTKTTYYPNLSKSELFPDYIATRSGHSRGATLDLTLVPIQLQRRRQRERPSRDLAPRRKRATRPTAVWLWARASIAST